MLRGWVIRLRIALRTKLQGLVTGLLFALWTKPRRFVIRLLFALRTKLRGLVTGLLFTLRTRIRPPWDRSPITETYWCNWKNSASKRCRLWVCLVPSRRFHLENWAFSLFVALVVSASSYLVPSRHQIMPLLPCSATSLVYSVFFEPPEALFLTIRLLLLTAIGLVPVLVWTIGMRLFRRPEVLSYEWAQIDPSYRPWMEQILNARGSKSPLIWSRDSAGEKLLREAMLDTFAAADEGPRRRSSSAARTSANSDASPMELTDPESHWNVPLLFLYFAAPIYLAFAAFLSQFAWFAICCSDGNAPKAMLSLVLVLWGLIGYWYFLLQRRRILNYLGPSGWRPIPAVRQRFRPRPPDLSTSVVELGVPGAIAAGISIGLAAIQNLN